MSKKKKIWINVIAALIFLLYIFIAVPNLNPIYPDGAAFWCTVLTVFVLISQLGNLEQLIGRAAGRSEEPDVEIVYPKPKKKKVTRELIPFFAVLGAWVLVALVHLFSAPLFHVNTYRDQLPVPQIKEFGAEVQAIDTTQIPIVDQQLALKLADKKLGEKPALGSQVHLGEPTIQLVKGKLVWAVPLHHSGFFKWLSNLDGTPGYIVVSATDMQDVTYVESPKVKLHPDAYLMDKLVRRVRLAAGMFTGITDYSFELDDAGQPYYVVSTYRYLCGFSLPEVNGVIVVNATTGEMKKYKMDEIPAWVDRIQPEEFLMQQINNRGHYIHGVFNFSNFEKFQTSANDIIVYNNGKCYLFTGITSVGSDDSAIGLVMVDMRTKETIQYKVSGATEGAAMKSAEGKVQDLRYQATSPILLNIQSQPTYFMTLKDGEGLVKQYAFVSVRSYDQVGVGATVDEARRNYERIIGTGHGKPTDKQVTAEGKVIRIAGEYDGSQVVYSMILDSRSNLIFRISGEKSAELALTCPGDLVSVTYAETESGVVKAAKFDNLMFSQEQEKPEEEASEPVSEEASSEKASA